MNDNNTTMSMEDMMQLMQDMKEQIHSLQERNDVLERQQENNEHNKKRPPYYTKEEVIRRAINSYFEKHDNDWNDLYELKASLSEYINNKIQLDNTQAKCPHKKYGDFQEYGVAELIHILPNLIHFETIKRSDNASRDKCDLKAQNSHGWFDDPEDAIIDVFRVFSPSKKIKQNIDDVVDKVKTLIGEPKMECSNQSYVPMNNGIFCKEYWEKHHELIPYTAENIFINPFTVDFNPDATNPEIKMSDGSIFNVEDWFMELANNNQGLKDLLWSVVSAIMYCNRKYDKCAFLYSPIGNNGKGTFAELCRHLVGHRNVANLAIPKFSEPFIPEVFINSRLVVGDENPTNAYDKNSADFKAAITQDPIIINRKNKPHVEIVFRGMMLQCMNSLPRSADKTNSQYRRYLMIPFNNCFTGKENKNIRSDFMRNKDVLEYVAHKALMLNAPDNIFDDEFLPQESLDLLYETKAENDLMLQWWEHRGSQLKFAWDRVPSELLLSSFKKWCQQYAGSHDCNVGLKKFSKDFKLKILPTIADEWTWGKFNTTQQMLTVPEPLIGEFDVTDLKNPNYTGKEWVMIGSNGGQYDSQNGKRSFNGLIMKGSVK